MSQETDWFEGRSEKQQERCYWRRIGFAIFLALALMMLLLPMGCAIPPTGPFMGTCGIQQMGQNEQGVQFIRYYCEPAK